MKLFRTSIAQVFLIDQENSMNKTFPRYLMYKEDIYHAHCYLYIIHEMHVKWDNMLLVF